MHTAFCFASTCSARSGPAAIGHALPSATFEAAASAFCIILKHVSDAP